MERDSTGAPGGERTENQAYAEVAATGPASSTPEGRSPFIEMLNARLPTKRLIAQGVLRDEQGRVLLCELVYKQAWDLPGGVVDPGESPAACIVREVREELGIEITVERLVTVCWLPPYRGWDDALLCLFDLGVAAPGLLDEAVLQPREIKAVHWADAAEVPSRVAPYTARILAEVDLGRRPGTPYLEDGRPGLRD